ncbi:MAG: MerR family transcriptional regulator [Solobacterium sp.]|nr:MerR family transcriptional regulator [Solobacterium sp.]
MAEREPFSKVSDLHNWLGLSENGIRLYEREGIISPKRNSTNRYRELNISDGDRMFRSRILTGYGFSVKESADLLIHCSYDEQDQAYAKKEQELSNEIISLTYKLKQMQEMRAVMQEIRNNINACMIIDSVRYCFLPVHDQYQNKEAGNAVCSIWLSTVPSVTSTVIFDPADNTKYLYGPSLKYADALRLQLPLEQAIDFGVQTPHLVRGFCRYSLEDNIRLENIAHLKTYAEAQGYKLSGPVMTRHILLEKISNGGFTYDEVLIPVI